MSLRSHVLLSAGALSLLGSIAVPGASADGAFVVDRAGDANGVDAYFPEGSVPHSGLPSEPGADVLTADVVLDGDDLVFWFTVTDLVEEPPADFAGRAFYWAVTVDDAVYLTARAQQVPGEPSATVTYGSRRTGSTVEFAAAPVFDADADLIEIRVPLADVNGLARVIDATEIGPGSSLSDPSVQTYALTELDLRALSYRGHIGLRNLDVAGSSSGASEL